MTKEERKRQIRQRIIIPVLVGTLFFGGVKGIDAWKQYDKNHLTLSEVEEEIKIHTGHMVTPDGKKVNPYLEHGCNVPNDGRTFEERLVDRMEEEGYNIKTIQAAQDMFNYYYNDQFEEAKSIDLKQIEKEAVQESLSAKSR